jgi:hypothetical protein
VTVSARTVCVVIFLTSPAMAMEIEEIGTMQTTFDGESITMPTVLATRDTERSATAYLFRQGAGFSHLTISSHSPGNPRVFVNVDYFAETPGRETAPHFIEVTYAPPGTRQHWTSEEAPTPASVTFTTLDMEGEEGRAVGRFEAQLCFAEDYGADADLDNCRTIEGSFDTRFFIEE